MKAKREVEIKLHTFLTSTLEWEDVKFHAPATLPPGNEPVYPLDKRLDVSCSRSGPGGGAEKDPYAASENPLYPISCSPQILINLWPKYFHEHFVFKQMAFMFIPQNKIPRFITIQTNWQNNFM
jgi:hypothetical protein